MALKEEYCISAREITVKSFFFQLQLIQSFQRLCLKISVEEKRHPWGGAGGKNRKYVLVA